MVDLEIHLPSPGMHLDISYSWDRQERLVGIVNPYAERVTVTLDALDTVVRALLGNGVSVSHTFDAAGRETLGQEAEPSCCEAFGRPRTFVRRGARGTRVTASDTLSKAPTERPRLTTSTLVNAGTAEPCDTAPAFRDAVRVYTGVLGQIGDIVQFTPTVRRMKELWPHAEITFAGSAR